MKYFAAILLLGLIAIAFAGKLPESAELKPELKPEAIEPESAEPSNAEASRNKRGLLYSAYAAPYAAAYSYPYASAYSYPVAYTAPVAYAGYRSYYPSYYGSYVIG